MFAVDLPQLRACTTFSARLQAHPTAWPALTAWPVLCRWASSRRKWRASHHSTTSLPLQPRLHSFSRQRTQFAPVRWQLCSLRRGSQCRPPPSHTHTHTHTHTHITPPSHHSPALAIDDAPRVLCDDTCAASLESVTAVTTPTGLQYKDIVVGTGRQRVIAAAVHTTHYDA